MERESPGHLTESAAPRAEVIPLGRHVDPRVLTFYVAFVLVLAACALVFAALVGHWKPATPLAVGFAWLAFLHVCLTLMLTAHAKRSKAGSVTVGDDGVLFDQGADRTFYSYRQIRAVTVTPRAGEGRSEVRLLLANGGEFKVLYSSPGASGTLVERRFGARIDAARLRYLARAPAVTDDQLGRAGRSIARWRADLAHDESAFRAPEQPTEAIAELLASPSAAVDQRVGAALTLRRLTDDANVRIRVAAGATADPSLREALESVAGDEIDEERLEAALRATGSP